MRNFFLSDFWFTLTRLWVELGGMVVIGTLLFLLGMGGKEGAPAGVALFMYKALLFSASQVHAMITRKIFFPYLDFSKADPMSKALIIAIHVIAAYVYAEGG